MSGHQSHCPVPPSVLIALLPFLLPHLAQALAENEWNFPLVAGLRSPGEPTDERTSPDYLSILQGKRNPG